MNTENNFGLSTILLIIKKWLNQIIIFVALMTITATIVCFILPKQYYASTTALPVNAQLTDKARIFNNNIQTLYAVYGTDDDLDRLYITAKTRDVLLFVIDSLKLIAHYDISATQSKAIEDALGILKKNIAITKTENGALKIEVWDKNALFAEAIAAAILQRTDDQATGMMQQNNENIIVKLSSAISEKEQQLKSIADADARQKFSDQIAEQQKILDEFVIAAKVDQPSLMILEKPYHSFYPDKPKFFFIIAAAFLLSFFFSILCVVIIENVRAK